MRPTTKERAREALYPSTPEGRESKADRARQERDGAVALRELLERTEDGRDRADVLAGLAAVQVACAQRDELAALLAQLLGEGPRRVA